MKIRLTIAALALLGLGAFLGSVLTPEPAPVVETTATAAPQATPSSTTTTLAPAAPEPQVITRTETREVVRQACRDAVTVGTEGLLAISADWNAWATAHAGGATVEDYQAATQHVIDQSNALAAQVQPLAAECVR